MRKPYYKMSNKLWYVTIDGRQVRLGRTEEEAYTAWERMRAAGGCCAPNVQFRALADRWLTEHRRELTDVKFERCCSYLGRFCKHIGSLHIWPNSSTGIAAAIPYCLKHDS